MHRTKEPWPLVTAALIGVLVMSFLAPTLFAQTSENESQRLLALFQQVFTFVQNNYVDEVDSRKLMEGALRGLFESLEDPHSAFLAADDMRGLSDTTAGSFGGVGLYINKQRETERDGVKQPRYIEIVAPIEDTPAYRAGLRPGDLIIRVGDQSTDELDTDRVVGLLRGPAGSEVTITVRRGDAIVFDVTLTRAVIQVPTVRHAMIPGGIGYLRIIQFTPFTPPKVEEAIGFFRDAGYTSLIIDLRSNPGGLLSAVVDTADLFFDDGPIVSTRGRIARENAVFEARRGVVVPPDLPIVVLIDGGSASASEILAGSLKDRGRAFLIGANTYGKGSVQQVRSLGIGGFRLTMSRYYTPRGVTIDKHGVSPDREVREPVLSEAEIAAYSKLLSENVIRDFVRANPSPDEAAVASFVSSLRVANSVLSETLLRRLVRSEVNRHKDNPPIFDLEYDLALQEAVRHLRALPR